MKSYYLLEVLEGVYFSQFKGDKDSLVYTVDQEEAWVTENPQFAENMKICLWKLYQVHSKVKVYPFTDEKNDRISFA